MLDQNKTVQIDRLVKEPERKSITSISRVQAWKLEQKGLFPKRRRLTPSGSSVAWLLSELVEWVQSREVINNYEVSNG